MHDRFNLRVTVKYILLSRITKKVYYLEFAKLKQCHKTVSISIYITSPYTLLLEP